MEAKDRSLKDAESYDDHRLREKRKREERGLENMDTSPSESERK